MANAPPPEAFQFTEMYCCYVRGGVRDGGLWIGLDGGVRDGGLWIGLDGGAYAG